MLLEALVEVTETTMPRGRGKIGLFNIVYCAGVGRDGRVITTKSATLRDPVGHSEPLAMLSSTRTTRCCFYRI